jgi:hypothetical protein
MFATDAGEFPLMAVRRIQIGESVADAS